jgi:hypothetical protein
LQPIFPCTVFLISLQYPSVLFTPQHLPHSSSCNELYWSISLALWRHFRCTHHALEGLASSLKAWYFTGLNQQLPQCGKWCVHKLPLVSARIPILSVLLVTKIKRRCMWRNIAFDV